jgi:hypothetical protein
MHLTPKGRTRDSALSSSTPRRPMDAPVSPPRTVGPDICLALPCSIPICEQRARSMDRPSLCPQARIHAVASGTGRRRCRARDGHHLYLQSHARPLEIASQPSRTLHARTPINQLKGQGHPVLSPARYHSGALAVCHVFRQVGRPRARSRLARLGVAVSRAEEPGAVCVRSPPLVVVSDGRYTLLPQHDCGG